MLITGICVLIHVPFEQLCAICNNWLWTWTLLLVEHTLKTKNKDCSFFALSRFTVTYSHVLLPWTLCPTFESCSTNLLIKSFKKCLFALFYTNKHTLSSLEVMPHQSTYMLVRTNNERSEMDVFTDRLSWTSVVSRGWDTRIHLTH